MQKQESFQFVNPLEHRIKELTQKPIQVYNNYIEKVKKGKEKLMAQIMVLIVLILVNGYFAASEIAFISLNDAKVAKQAKQGNKKAKQILKMLENPSRFLATIQIGITLAGFLSSAFASDAFASKLAPILNQWIPMVSISVWQSVSIVVITIILSFFT